MKRTRTVLLVLVGLGGAVRASDAPVQPPSADQLFAIVAELRSSAVAGHADDPRFFSRAWLEQSIRSTDSAVDDPEVKGLNWVKDSFLASMNAVSTIERIYSYTLVKGDDAGFALNMHDFGCSKPSTLTLKFVFEEGAWRIAGLASSTTTSGTSWYQSELVPLKQWQVIPQRDRSRHVNDSNLGKALGLTVKSLPCA